MSRSAAVFLLALLCTLLPAECEIYKFDKEAAPAPYTLEAKYLFYAHIKQDAPRGANQARVSFEELRLHTKQGVDLSDYVSVQVSVLPWEDMFKVVDSKAFCTPQGNDGKMSNMMLALQDVEAKKHVHLHTVKAPQLNDASFELEASGAYVLVVTNCGNQEDIHMSGSVSVQNPYGYLPGNEYFKLPMYGWSVLIWVAAFVAWAATMLVNKDNIFYVHYTLMGIICICVAESACWWLHLSQTNDLGEFSQLASGAEVLSVMKACYLMILFLLVGFGVGVTCRDVEPCRKYKIMLVSSLYTLAALPKVCIFSLRHRHALTDNVVFGASVPVALTAAVVFCWILRGVSSQMRRFRETQEAESLKLYQRMAILCVLGFMASLAALGLQISDKPGRGTKWWQYHVLSSDGISQVGFFVVVSAMMLMWRPRAEGFATSYMEQEEEKETDGLTEVADDAQGDGVKIHQAQDDDKLFVVGGDPFEDNEDDEESGELRTGQPRADTIGAPAFAGAE